MPAYSFQGILALYQHSNRQANQASFIRLHKLWLERAAQALLVGNLLQAQQSFEVAAAFSSLAI